MKGDRMALAEAQGVLGRRIALNSNLGWYSGTVVAVVDRPQIVVQDEQGDRHYLVIDIISEWLAGTPTPDGPLNAPENGEG